MSMRMGFIFVLVYSVQAFALVPVGAARCASSAVNIVQRAAAQVQDITKRFNSLDDIVQLKDAEKLGITADELRHLRQATGYVMCPRISAGPNEEGQPPRFGGASLVGDNSQIITNAHVVAINGKVLRNCVFRNFEVPYKEVALNFDVGNYRLGSDTVDSGAKYTPIDPKDTAVVRLRQPLAGVQPLSVMPASRLSDSDSVFVPSPSLDPQSMAKLKYPPGLGVMQKCSYVGQTPAGQGGFVYSGNCLFTNHTSGTGNFARDVRDGNRLKLVGITVGGGRAVECSTYSPARGCESFSIGIDEGVLDELKKISNNPSSGNQPDQG